MIGHKDGYAAKPGDNERLSLTPEIFECPVLAVSYVANTSQVLAHNMLRAVWLHTETL